jgi:DNA-binding response OmpR family regulator
MLSKPSAILSTGPATRPQSRRIALVGVSEAKAAVIGDTLEAAGIASESVSVLALSGTNGFDGAIYDLEDEDLGDANLELKTLRAKLAAPVMVVGRADDLLARMDEILQWADETLAEPWSDASLVLGVTRLISRGRTAPRSVSPRHTGPRVLIADDDPSSIRLLQAILARHGMELCSASDGPTALSLIRLRPPDVVLLDVNMPGMNGLTVLAKIRSELGMAKLPIALLTSYSDSARVSEALRLGADDYIVKPFKSTEIARRITRLLSRGRSTNRQAGEDFFETDSLSAQ